MWFDCDQPEPDELDELGTRLGINEFVLEDLRNSGQRTKLDHYSDHFHVAVHDCVRRSSGSSSPARSTSCSATVGCCRSVRRRTASTRDELGPFPIDTVRQRFEAQLRAARFVGRGLPALGAARRRRRPLLRGDRHDRRLPRRRRGRRARRQLRRRRDGPARAPPPALRPQQDDRRVPAQRRAAPRRRRRRSSAARPRAWATPPSSTSRTSATTSCGSPSCSKSQRDVLTNLRDAELAVVSNRLNRSMQKLTAWGAILIVATLITGVLGMNFKQCARARLA